MNFHESQHLHDLGMNYVSTHMRFVTKVLAHLHCERFSCSSLTICEDSRVEALQHTLTHGQADCLKHIFLGAVLAGNLYGNTDFVWIPWPAERLGMMPLNTFQGLGAALYV